MKTELWKGRKARILENGRIRLVYLPGGGHIGALELLDGPAKDLNPLWEPPWPSIEPEDYDPARHDSAYYGPPEGRLLASIRGHNICFPWFGPPTEDEEDRGLGVHGEAPVTTWIADGTADGLEATVILPKTGFAMKRKLALKPGSAVVRFETEAENRSGKVVEVGWQEHVSLGPPFLEGGVTTIDHNGKRGWVIHAYGKHHGLKPDSKFMWPQAPRAGSGETNLRIFTSDKPRGDFTAQRMEGSPAWFAAVNPRLNLMVGYIWDPKFFPWLDFWTESGSVPVAPWHGKTVSCGLEFGLAPTTERPLPKQVLGAPTKAIMQPGARLSTVFHAFISAVPGDCSGVKDVRMEGDTVSVALLSPAGTISVR